MSYTVEIWVMDGEGGQDPDYSYRFTSKTQMITFMHHLILEGGCEGSMVERMDIINDTTNNHMI